MPVTCVRTAAMVFFAGEKMRALRRLVQGAFRAFGYEVRRHRPDQFEVYAGPTRYLDQPPSSKIHYGCGGVLMRGWLNVDWSGAAAADGALFQALNLVEAHPFPDEAFEYGYAEDFLEHLSQADSIIFLTEVHRTLKPGGVIRLSFPGLEGVLIRHYPKAATSQGSYLNSIKGKHEAFTIWDHVHFYSMAELSVVAKHVGFRATRFCEHGESDHESLRGIDSRQDQRALNTYAELVK